MVKKLAIIIAAYDCAEYIIECVNSILFQQPVKGWQYDLRLGVDACEKTAEKLREKQISFYWSKKNVGAYVMRNSLMDLGLANAYSYFDADDIMLTNYLRMIIQLLELGHDSIMLAKRQVDSNLRDIPGKRNPIVQDGGAITFTDEILMTLGGFKSYRCAADTDFMRRVEMAGFKIHKEKSPAYYLRRIHDKNATKVGLTKYGGEYRKQAWQEMTAERQAGNVFVDPEIVELERVE